eukprot:CAMPEP_0115863938 /NCGR_PEP_ID=MMETSP0287-20121206/18943_1 /TAXON_ID=412157 /ORGANISM="Chrysochromulina rotalis, Strain UIO044" /LENGTH=49 /DNA_ID=CAMNT_0003318393 /DNA_START=498 /DNA_END=647 /DNA_ORIENTATION=+
MAPASTPGAPRAAAGAAAPPIVVDHTATSSRLALTLCPSMMAYAALACW